MNKEKTLDVLRGMKFMQRKEEARRRATYEEAQREELEGRLAAAASRDAAAGPTIFYDDIVPSSFYAHARRTFANAGDDAEPADTKASAATGDKRPKGDSAPRSECSDDDDDDVGSAGEAGRKKSGKASGATTTWDDVLASAGDEEEEETGETYDPSAAPRAENPREGRFQVPGSFHGPKLPKGLSEYMKNNNAGRKRARDE